MCKCIFDGNFRNNIVSNYYYYFQTNLVSMQRTMACSAQNQNQTLHSISSFSQKPAKKIKPQQIKKNKFQLSVQSDNKKKHHYLSIHFSCHHHWLCRVDGQIILSKIIYHYLRRCSGKTDSERKKRIKIILRFVSWLTTVDISLCVCVRVCILQMANE